MIVSARVGVTNFWTGFRVHGATFVQVSAKGHPARATGLHGCSRWPGRSAKRSPTIVKTENAPSGGAGRSLEHRPATKWLRLILKLPPNKTRGS